MSFKSYNIENDREESFEIDLELLSRQVMENRWSIERNQKLIDKIVEKQCTNIEPHLTDVKLYKESTLSINAERKYICLRSNIKSASQYVRKIFTGLVNIKDSYRVNLSGR